MCNIKYGVVVLIDRLFIKYGSLCVEKLYFKESIGRKISLKCRIKLDIRRIF